MENKTRTRSCILIFLGLLLLALIIFIGYRYMTLRLRANIAPPQVLIHSPTDQKEVDIGVGTLVHATARAEKGISRIELWVDGEFIHAEEPSDGVPISPLVLHTFWRPIGTGKHEIVIRAIDAKQVEGVGSILVIASHPDEIATTGTDPLAEADTPEDEPVGDTPSDTAPPDSPSDEGGGGSGYTPPGDPPAPPPADEEPPPTTNPGTEFTIMEVLFGGFALFDLGEDEETPESTDGPALLTLEVLDLQTDADYELVHCYVGLGGSSPRWYPDTDLDPATDEYFSPIGDMQWNVADFLGEGNGVHAPWPSSDPIPFSINCIATTALGTEAVDLGRTEVNAPRDEWDGVTRSVLAAAEGSYQLSYRITRRDMIPKGLDPSIPVPYNLRIDERRQELHWEWEDTPDNAGAGVVGYLVYLNDVLVFAVDGRMNKSARIPYAWFSPPCRTNYEFTVRAYKYPYPDGDYSDASEPAVIPDPADPPRTDCQPEFIVEFHRLRTGNLPADGRDNNWAGLIGPISGSFFANGEETIFQGYDLLPNQSYNLNDMTWESARMYNQVVIEPTPGEHVTVGFDLAELVGGSSMGGFSDVCGSMYDTYSYSMLMEYSYFEETLYSVEDDGTLCQVDYTIRPMDGSPLGGGEDLMPLPWLDIIGIRINPPTGTLLLDIKNRGSAPWVNHDLRIDFVRSDGNETARGHTEFDFVLEVGETKTISTTETIDSLWYYCFILDPNNEVLELYEHSGALDHTLMEYCYPRPDLNLMDVQYDFNENELRMRIWNTGEGSGSLGRFDLDLADLVARIEPRGESVYIYSNPREFSGEILRQGEGTWVVWQIHPNERERMENGYTVRLDPDNRIAETDEDNNSISVRGGETLRVVWNGGHFRWYPNSILYECPRYGRWSRNDIEIWVSLYARSEYSNRRLESWHWEGTVNDSDRVIPLYGWDPDRFTTDVYLHGEEFLEIEVRGEQEGDSMDGATGYYDPAFDWYSLESISEAGRCSPEDDLDGGRRVEVTPYWDGWGMTCGWWWVYVNTCEVDIRD